MSVHYLFRWLNSYGKIERSRQEQERWGHLGVLGQVQPLLQLISKSGRREPQSSHAPLLARILELLNCHVVQPLLDDEFVVSLQVT